VGVGQASELVVEQELDATVDETGSPEAAACVECGADASRGGIWVTNLAGVQEPYCRTCASINFPVV
jgi:hypothetical protein